MLVKPPDSNFSKSTDNSPPLVDIFTGPLPDSNPMANAEAVTPVPHDKVGSDPRTAQQRSAHARRTPSETPGPSSRIPAR